MTPFIIDFDTNDWMLPLKGELGSLLPQNIGSVLRDSKPEFVEDARDVLCDAASDPEALIDRTVEWIKASDVWAFHGTRLTSSEAEELRRAGLQTLDIEQRIDRLFAIAPDIAAALSRDKALGIARSHSMGNRAGQVHLAISRQFTKLGYEYHREGSEFDRRLLQAAGLETLLPQVTRRGQSWLVSVRLSGEQALDGMHPFFPIDYMRENERYPNLVRQLLEEFAWNIYRPDSPRYPIDACFMFRTSISGSAVIAVEPID